MTTAGGAGDHPWDANRESGSGDPRGVLLSVEQLVMAAGESVRRLRHVQSVSRRLGDWADEKALGEMAAQLAEVRSRLTRLRDQARQGASGTAGDAPPARPDPPR